MSQTNPLIDKLAPLRAHKGKRRTTGLDDATLAKFAASHPELAAAVDAAAAEYANIKDAFADLLDLDEDAQVQAVQAGFVNFYPQDGVNPYRSEEHTSELQSLMRISYAVFCLKKKKKTTN